MTGTVSKHLYISGRVQGVGFRHFIKTRAEDLNLQGWVRNLNDGRVELLVSGEKGQVNSLISKARKGPSWARVEEIKIENSTEEVAGNGFRIRY